MEKSLRQHFHCDIFCAYQTGDLPAVQFSESELATYSTIKNLRRKNSWSRGRFVLKKLLERMEQDADTASITFPHRAFSLSHSGECAIAVFLKGEQAKGIGVDLEFLREIKDESARFFLNDAERTWYFNLPPELRMTNLIRLWTIKEAVFKSDLQNDSQTLSRYALFDPSSSSGQAERQAEAETFVFDYLSLDLGQSWLSVALARPKELR
ncbi:MAG: 4'-phosphopantetheinyl transferase superfamily protein [Candidatus Obscuribacterales bacterium]|nr:4'-phosphopantetheinyl transferase superfamily protein [Candidatus Obscuribacterales bacterium]